MPGRSAEAAPVQIDLDPRRCKPAAFPADVANALAAQNLITPIGAAEDRRFEYALDLNGAPSRLADLGDLPIKTVDGAMVFVRDVAQVHDGNAAADQYCPRQRQPVGAVERVEERFGLDLDIISGVKQKLAEIKPALPPSARNQPLGDQSLFVRAAIEGVAREGAIAAALTSLMILLFLGSWRSTLIIATSIPLPTWADRRALGDWRNTQHHDARRTGARRRHPRR